MTSSFVTGVGTAMTSVWRVHTQLDESDEPDSSPVAPKKMRKLRSSSSLNTLRMSLRKRLPLKSVQSNDTNNTDNPSRGGSLEPNSKTNVVRHLTRTAKNSITGAYQKFQKRQVSREDCLVSTPGKSLGGEEQENAGICPTSSSRTPRSTRKQFTPRSSARRTPRRTPRPGTTRETPRKGGGCTPGGASEAVRGVRSSGCGRRQLVRMAALRSPFASPNTVNRRRQFEQELDGVSSGLRKLKSLSQALNAVIGRDERVFKYTPMAE